MVYTGGGTCSLQLASIKCIPCKQPRWRHSAPALQLCDSLLRCVYSLLRKKKKKRLLWRLDLLMLSKRFGAVGGEKVTANSSSQAVFPHICVAGDDLFKHTHLHLHKHEMERAGRTAITMPEVSRSRQQGHFTSHRTINYIPPLSPLY